MSPVWKIAVAFGVALVVACLAAPAAYFLVHAAGWAWLAEFPFHRFFSRSVQVCGVAAAVVLAFWLGIRSPRELGLERNAMWGRDLGAGFLAAFLPSVALAAGYLAWELYRPQGEVALLPLGRIAVTAAVVACVEEFLFRGVLFGLAARAVGALPAAAGVSLVFAAVHFVRPVKTAEGAVDWLSGFRQAAGALGNWPPWPVWGYGFALLFLVGMFLCWTTWRTRSLWLAIGLHAGWIFGQQGLGWFAKPRMKESLLPWVGPNLVSGAVPTGLLPAAALAVCAAAVWFYLRNGAGRGRS